MRRGTTPTHIFNVDLDLTDAEVLYITYRQDGNVTIEKTKDDLTIEADKLTVRLSQEETLSLNTYQNVEIQIRAGFADGSRVASNIISTDARRILKDGEI